MDEKWNSRTEILLGKEGIEKLKNAKVIIYGIGGVGSFVVEGLARAGVGNLILVDKDTISKSNINRQIHSNINTIGREKTEVMKERILEINPNCNVEVYNPNELEFDEEELINNSIDYVVDAIDTIKQKIKIIVKAKELGVPIISAMGAGNKLDPTKFEVSDIYKTSVCPLAKVIRKELKKRNIKKLKVVYSKEERININKDKIEENLKNTVGSISFVPSVMGLIMAGEIIKDISK